MQIRSIYDQQLLLKKIATGDTVAFRELFDLYRNRLYASALKITREPHIAEDIVQDIFIALWEGKAGLGQIDNPSAYIFTVAYNKTFQYLKKMAANTALVQELIVQSANGDRGTEEWLEIKECQALIHQAIEELPARRQLIYKLSREQGFSHDEIARQLNISRLTVKKQIVLALDNIRTSLAKSAPLLALFFLRDLC